MEATTEYTNRCACGWEVTGIEDVVVDATVDHAQRIHNMEAAREHVLAARRDKDAAPEATAG